MGSINIILGCMFSGKSTELIRLTNRFLSIGKKVLRINYTGDDRYTSDDSIISHDKNKTDCIKIKNLSSVDEKTVIDSDVIIIDEAQFYDDLVIFCVHWADDLNKKIIVSGLDGTFERKPFKNLQILELIPHCESVIKLPALCHLCKDGTEAYFSWRMSSEKKEIDIGGSEKYIAVCRKHYLDLKK